MIKAIQKGFTLIELLVVITIIGILATGAVTTFTSQIQKARDTTRISDVKALQGAIEQGYQDQGEYPGLGVVFDTDVDAYLPRLPSDPKTGVFGTGAFDYLYNSSADTNNIPGQEYEISTTFEQEGNINSKAYDTADSGNDNARLELGINVDDTDHLTSASTAISGYSATNRCSPPAGGAAGTTCNGTNPTIIRTN